MARRPKWAVSVTETVSSDPLDEVTLTITGLKKAQLAFIRCMLQADYEVDPVEEWGFKKKDGDLQSFLLDVATSIEQRGY